MLARAEMNSLESSQLKHRKGHGADSLVDVKLWHLVAFAIAGVGDFHQYLCAYIGRYLCGLHAHVFQFEIGIAQAVPERKQRAA